MTSARGAGGDEGHPAGTGPPAKRRNRLARLAFGILALAVVVVLVLRAPSAASEFVSAFRHFRVSRLPWVAVAEGLEAASLACMAMVQRKLLQAEGCSIAFPTLLALVVASTAVVDLIPAGVAPSSGWVVEQFRSRRVPVPLGLWTVMAAGFAATVSGLGQVLVGAGIAGLWSPIGLVICGAVLVGGSAAFVAVVHRLGNRRPSLGDRVRRPALRRIVLALDRAAQYRLSAPQTTVVFVFATLNALFDAGCLVVAFVLIGFPVPWPNLLFAYAASQTLGGLSFLRLGVVEGGLVGAFVLAGTSAGPALAATLMYRVFAYWLIAGIGAVAFAVMNRRQPLGTGRAAPGD